MNRKVLLTSLLYIVLSTGAFAQSLGIKVPAQDTQRLSIENLNFTAAGFMAAYMSKDVGQRRLAEMYLIGVLDATEGRAWCDYRVVLPGSIQEQVYMGFKKESEASLKSNRASDIITSILSKKLPCKVEK